MDNAGRRNIHVQAACREAGPSAKASACRRPFADRDARPCDRFRRSLPASRMSLREFPHEASPDPSPRRRREAEMYDAATDRASPTWGRNGGNLRWACANCAKTYASGTAPPPLPPLRSAARPKATTTPASQPGHELRGPECQNRAPPATNTGTSRPLTTTPPATRSGYETWHREKPIPQNGSQASVMRLTSMSWPLFSLTILISASRQISCARFNCPSCLGSGDLPAFTTKSP